MNQLGQQLREIAERQPPPVIHIGLYDRARRRSSYRKGAAVVTIAASAVTVASLATSPRTQPDTVRGGALSELTSAGVGGPLGWIALAIVLAALGFLWRHLPFRKIARRLTAVAIVGAVIVLASPPGTALWGEPRGQIGLPDRLAEPSSWTLAANLKHSPPGKVALVFSGPATNGDLEEGRIALLAADGDRYRVFDVFLDPLSWSAYDYLGPKSPVLSPDGRYLASDHGTFDLTTGQQLDQLRQQPPSAWSADSNRIAYRIYETNTQRVTGWQIWDLPSRRMIREIINEAPAHNTQIALSPAGDRLAVRQNNLLAIYPVDGGAPASWPYDGWLPASTTAFSPDGTLLALKCDDCAEKTDSIRIVDARTGSIVDDGVFSPPGQHVKVQGWRSPTELVMQSGNAVDVYTIGDPAPARLLTLPPGITRVEIATDRLADPIRPAGPPTYGPPNTVFWLGVALVAIPLALVVGAFILARWLLRRIRKRRNKSHA
ncbi:WD40 repeat domain-containing protein [Catelliglobosispora koreensis]|uniref:WD40 repeat domain-containing protein n=1 Tax=Catelliglobosispora koreensis TaxID=129052 RepID=UPI00037B126F|nr:hypothetical protein [Catelliglobosispora koreensis]